MAQGQARPLVEEIASLNQGRVFLQWCGPLPSSPVLYSGRQAQYLALEGVSRPWRGGINQQRMPGDLPKTYKTVGRSEDPPDFATATLRMTEIHGTIPIQWSNMRQPFNAYVVRGACDRLDDFNNLQDGCEVYSWALAGSTDFGARTPGWEGDDPLDDSTDLTLVGGVYFVGPLGFQSKGSTETNTEVAAVTYGLSRGCGNCGYGDRDGTKAVYAVTKPGTSSPGLLPEIIYTTDGGSSWSQASIDSFGATEQPLAIAVVGQYLVILGSSAYYYAAINARTGTIGSFTKVSTGFNATYAPQDMIALSPREVWFVGLGGVVYFSSDITAGVSVIAATGDVTSNNLRRIKASGNALVAVGDSGTIIFSANAGSTWATSPTTPTAWGFRAVEVLDEYRWWIGSGAGQGRLWYTTNGGYTWTERTLESSNEVNDITFATDEVGWVSYATTTPAARLMGTWNGGADWVLSTNSAQRRIQNLPTHARINRVAVPDALPGVAANNVVLGSASTGSTDGLILFGAGNTK